MNKISKHLSLWSLYSHRENEKTLNCCGESSVLLADAVKIHRAAGLVTCKQSLLVIRSHGRKQA